MRNNNICSAAAHFKCALHEAELFTNRREHKTLTNRLGNYFFVFRSGSGLAFRFFKPLKTLFLLLVFGFISALSQAGDIALIIDDIGNKPEDIKAFSLPSEITFAILPHTPYSTPFSQLAEQQQREVMLHIPMELSLIHI